jgi:hypothetical protein
MSCVRKIALIGFSIACVALAGCSRPGPPALPAAADTSAPSPPPTARKPVAPPMPEPRAIAARAEAIHRDAEPLRGECARAAGGDWERWQRETEPYRLALKSRLDKLRLFQEEIQGFTGRRVGWQEPLAGRQDFPLFEMSASESLVHLYAPARLRPFREQRTVPAARRWLGRRGIDLIFVPVPKMAEVYVENFLDPCPADGVVAPEVRQTLLELLEQDVEVVDVFRLFRAARQPDPDYLYNAAETHWAPRAMRIVARELATRIGRYGFGERARNEAPIFKSSPVPYVVDVAWRTLTEKQLQLVRAAQPKTIDEVTLPSGQPVPDDDESPVFLMGNSYVRHFREQLIRELNLPVRTRWGGGLTTEAFADFLRDPTLLDHCRVLIWVTSEEHMTHFQPLPAPVLAALTDGKP